MKSVSWKVYGTVCERAIEHIKSQAYRRIECQVEWYVSENVSEQGLHWVEEQIQDKFRWQVEGKVREV